MKDEGLLSFASFLSWKEQRRFRTQPLLFWGGGGEGGGEKKEGRQGEWMLKDERYRFMNCKRHIVSE